MITTKRILSTIIAMVAAVAVMAQDGSVAYNFMNIPLSSRIYGLGGVNISLVDDDITTIDQNPALLGQEMSGQLSLSYMRYIGDSNFAGLTYGHAAGENGAWSAQVRYFGYGSITETDEHGTILGTFAPNDVAFAVGYSHNITDRWRGGISAKVLYSSYADFSALAMATDLGVNYYDEEIDQSFSLVIANLGGQIKRFNESYDHLPIDVRLGWSQSFGTFPLRISVTAWNLTKWHLPYYETGDGTIDQTLKVKDTFSSNLFRHLVFGADLITSPNWYLGIGYNYKTRTDMSTYKRSLLSGFSLSGGISVGRFAIGCAFAQPHTGATTFMLNITASLTEFLN